MQDGGTYRYSVRLPHFDVVICDKLTKLSASELYGKSDVCASRSVSFRAQSWSISNSENSVGLTCVRPCLPSIVIRFAALEALTCRSYR